MIFVNSIFFSVQPLTSSNGGILQPKKDIPARPKGSQEGPFLEVEDDAVAFSSRLDFRVSKPPRLVCVRIRLSFFRYIGNMPITDSRQIFDFIYLNPIQYFFVAKKIRKLLVDFLFILCPSFSPFPVEEAEGTYRKFSVGEEIFDDLPIIFGKEKRVWPFQPPPSLVPRQGPE